MEQNNQDRALRLPPLESDQKLAEGFNVFAEILVGKIPASFVYRDELVAAFMDINPINTGHVLVVPIKTACFIHQLEEEVAGRMFWVAGKIATAIRQTDLQCEAINLYLADGSAAGQEVPHCHLHVVPRYRGDGFHLVSAKRTAPQREELQRNAEKIKSQLS